MTKSKVVLSAALALALVQATPAQIQGPGSGSTAYVLPLQPGTETISIFTTDNTGGAPDDVVLGYGMSGIPDGMGAFDNGDGTFTLLVNHEVPSALGVARAHGGKGAFISEWVISKQTLSVLSGRDLIATVYGWNAATQSSNPTPLVDAVFFRFCSADLAEPTAFFNAASGLGSTARIYLNGEEDGTHGWAMAHIATGSSKGNSYILGRFNLSTNGSGLTGIGSWENLVASPYAQDKTVVIGNNDGGTGIMSNALAVYVGTKQSTGTEADKAGLTNGTLKFVAVTGNPVEIVNAARETGITNGGRFTLSATASTTFSRPEDGAWNPLNPREYYFVTTDQLDQVSDGLGAQIGQTRLWRLTFDDIANPDAGGKIDALIDGRSINGQKVNMLDNITVNKKTGHLLLQEDVGGAAHNGKMWEYDPATDGLVMIAKHDPARFGDRAAGVTTAATLPFTNDEETSGVIDISDLMSGSPLSGGNAGEAWYISSDQAHYTNGITAAQVEGGQLFVIHQIGSQVARGGYVRDRRTGTYAQQLTVTNSTISALPGPLYIKLDNLSSNATLVNASGVAGNYIVVPGTGPGLGAAASASVILQFANPSSQAITFTTRVINSIPTP